MIILYLVLIHLSIIHITLTKDLHIKEELNTNIGSIRPDFSDLNKHNEISNNNERFARHLEAVTESVIEHIVKELKRLNPNMVRKNTSRIVKQLQTKLSRRRRQKKRNRQKKRRKGKTEERIKL